jgi:hypothetical protein
MRHAYPRLVARRVQGYCAPREDSAEVTIAIVALKADRGGTVCISGIHIKVKEPKGIVAIRSFSN